MLIALLSWFSFATRPDGAIATAWWPASGLAVGIAIQLRRRHMWWFAGAVGLVVLWTALGLGRAVALSISGSFAVVVEIVVAHLILRRVDRQIPGLRTREDLGRVLVSAFAAASAFAGIQALAALALGDPAGAMLQLVSAGPRHAAGILMVAPLFLRLPRQDRLESKPGVAIHALIIVVLALLVFLAPGHIPMAFLVMVPLVWGVLTIPIRWLLIEMLVVATIASYGSANNRGPFAFSVHGVDGASALLQVFELGMFIIVLVPALTALREREASALLGDSELLYRRNFENSLAGALIAVRSDGLWRIRSHNRAAAELFPGISDAAGPLRELLGASATQAITAIADRGAEGQVDVSVEDGRHFRASVAPLDLGSDEDCISIQLLDITDSTRAEQLRQAELNRAQQVQEALAPGPQPPRQGWEHGATAVTAAEIGGDFYDIQIQGTRAVLALGDVMGKGIGAGLLAAVARTALRSSSVASRPGEVLADAARVVEEDLARTGAFVTLALATIDLLSGQVRLADAGHGLSFVIRSDNSVERVASTDFPIGLGANWREIQLELAPGDSLLMVSDGVLDAWGTSIETLADTITGLSPQFAEQHVDAFVTALCEGTGSTGKRIDDATALMLRRERSPQ